MKHFLLIAFLLSGLGLLSACDDNKATPDVPSPQKIEKETKKQIDSWVGKWDGPEGTYLILEKSGEGYSIRIKDLDKEETFLGVADFLRIRFHRNDHEEYIHFGPGRDTGMKWLQDKQACLIIKEGEGYCRPEEKPSK